jgi:hypothetical protein
MSLLSLKGILNDPGFRVGVRAFVVIIAATFVGCVVAIVFGWPITIG